MRITDNPFYLLGVKVTDNADTIDEEAENKAFMDEENARLYDNARTTLTSPNRRLDAEIRWFYNDCPKIIKAIKKHTPVNETGLSFREKFLLYVDKLYRIDEDYFNDAYDYTEAVSDVVKIIKVIDNSYRWMLDDEEVDFLLSDIDDAREEAGISLLDDEDTLKTALEELLRDAREAISAFMAANDVKDVAKIVNVVAEEQINSSIGNKNKNYSDVIEQMILIYSDSIIKDELENYQDKILNMIDSAEEYTTVEALNPLCETVKVFDYYAQPIQLYLQDTGNSDKQDESNIVADRLRDLALYYHNEKGLTNLTKVINELIIEVFPELPGVLAQAQDDQEHIDEIISFDKVKDAVKVVIDDLANNVVHEHEYAQSNQNYIVANSCRWIQILDNSANVVRNSDSESKDDKYYLIAMAYSKIASACTWGECWQWALDYCLKGKNYARLSGDRDLIQKFIKDEKAYRENLRIEAQEEAEKEAERRAMNYSASWGAYSSESVYINADTIRYKSSNSDYYINFSDVKHILIGSKVVSPFVGDDYIQYILILYTDDQCRYGMTLNIDKDSKVFNEVMKRAWKAVGDRLIDEMLKRLRNGENIPLGNMYLNDEGVWINTSSGQHLFAWNDLNVFMHQGELYVVQRGNRYNSDKVDLVDAIDGRTAYVIMQIATEKGFTRISDIL